MILRELVAFPGCRVPGFADMPGAVTVDETSGASWLHHAPGRWLQCGTSALVEGALDACVTAAVAGGQATCFEIEGGYEGFLFEGNSARAALAATVNLEVVLPTTRDCAAVALFDCPAVLVRMGGGFAVWVSVSRVADFTAAAERAGHICAKL